MRTSLRRGLSRRHLAGLAAAAVLSVLHAPSWAQAFPSKPIKLVVSFAPGGPADIVARLFAQQMQERLGQPVVVENRAGAGGNIAAKFVTTQPADGYTLLVTTSALAVGQSLYKAPGFDAQKDLTAVASMAASPNILVVHPSDPAVDLKDYLLRRKGSELSYGSAGVGSTPHLSADHILRVLGGVKAQHIAYKGAGPALEAAMGNQLDLASVALPPAVPLVKAGKLKALAVTSLQRVPALPNVPTVVEAGFAGFEDLTWVGLFGPAGLPTAVTARLNSVVNDILRHAESRERLAQAGLDPLPGNAASFATYLQKEVVKWAKMVKDTGVTAE